MDPTQLALTTFDNSIIINPMHIHEISTINGILSHELSHVQSKDPKKFFIFECLRTIAFLASVIFTSTICIKSFRRTGLYAKSFVTSALISIASLRDNRYL